MVDSADTERLGTACEVCAVNSVEINLDVDYVLKGAASDVAGGRIARCGAAHLCKQTGSKSPSFVRFV